MNRVGVSVFVPINSAGFYGGEKIAYAVVRGLVKAGCTVVACMPEDGPLADALRCIGVTVERLHVAYGYYNPLAVDAIRRSLMRFRPSVVYTHQTQEREYCFGKAAQRLGIPVLVHRHNPLHFGRGGALAKVKHNRYVRVLNGVRKVLAVSSDVKGSLVGSGVTVPIKVIHNGIDATPTPLDKRLTFAAKRTMLSGWEMAEVVGYVGRFAESKGLLVLLDAVRILLKTRPAVRLVLVGEDIEKGAPTERSIRLKIAQMGLQEHVRLIGYIENIRKVYAALDVLALPSWGEGMPLVMIEAAFAGVPLVTTNVNGMAEFMVDGCTGYTVEPRDPVTLARALCALLEDGPKTRAMAKAGQEKAVTMFSQERMCQRVNDSVYETAGRASRRAGRAEWPRESSFRRDSV